MKLAFAILTMFFALQGCSPVVFQITTLVDSTDQSTVRLGAGNELMGYPLSQRVSLNIEERRTVNNETLYFLIIEYYHDSLLLKEWLGIQIEEPMTIRVDGEVVRILGIKTRYSQLEIEGHPVERLAFSTSVDFLSRLADAREVIVRVKGSGRTVERRFEPDNFQFFRSFLNELKH